MAKEETKTMITYAGLKKYEEELHELKVVRRQEVAEKIKVAREQGDLSENADYDAAKDEQSEIERRIVELESILKNAEVVVDEDDTENIEEYDEEDVDEVVEDEEEYDPDSGSLLPLTDTALVVGRVIYILYMVSIITVCSFILIKDARKQKK